MLRVDVCARCVARESKRKRGRAGWASAVCRALAGCVWSLNYRFDRNLAGYLPRLAVLVSIAADRPGLGFQVHWVYIKLGFPASTLVGTLNVRKC